MDLTSYDAVINGTMAVSDMHCWAVEMGARLPEAGALARGRAWCRWMGVGTDCSHLRGPSGLT